MKDRSTYYNIHRYITGKLLNIHGAKQTLYHTQTNLTMKAVKNLHWHIHMQARHDM